MHSVKVSQMGQSGTDMQENSLLAMLDRTEVTNRQFRCSELPNACGIIALRLQLPVLLVYA